MFVKRFNEDAEDKYEKKKIKLWEKVNWELPFFSNAVIPFAKAVEQQKAREIFDSIERNSEIKEGLIKEYCITDVLFRILKKKHGVK